ncbi:MAG TPA: enoyl-CoA hydratase [Candidatus Sulfotelmatobacter sp.]|nr:enoyl-CoA hydratase [Candidatus Sulfotelmatobacter sp.]
MPDLILTEIRDGLAVVTLNRPEKLNAFGDDMRERLAGALDHVAARADARVLVITGAGRAFCSGGDVKHMAALKRGGAPPDALTPLLAAAERVITKLAALPIPTIAAINGPAAGAGLNLALACDLRLASEQATFVESFVRIGLVPDWGGTYFLPRFVGLARALELIWLGESIDANEAQRLGLVSHVWPPASFERSWREFAARLAASPATSVRLAKRLLRDSRHRALAECLALENEAQKSCWAAPDVAEGLLAFEEKRAPKFTGEAARREEPSGASRFE